MIKANELRIGNWILVRSKNRAVNANHILALSNGVDFYSGIPLTPEILEKCGFEKKGNHEVLFFYTLPVSEVDEIAWINANKVVRYQTKINTFTKTIGVLYLHQLQNLYFALTGQELEVSL